MFNLQLFLYPVSLWLMLATQTTALATFLGPCPDNMTSIGKIDMKSYAGKWYTYSTYPSLVNKTSRCKSIEFIENNSTYTVKIKRLSQLTHTPIVKILRMTELDSATGKYVIQTENMGFLNGEEFYIVDTDYDNYAIQFTCFDSDSVFNFQSAVIYTRKRVPTAETVFNAQKIAQLSGIKISKMVKVDQEACPIDT